MRASIAIAAHNEGDRLWKTVQSCLETTRGLDCEIVIVDDASEDHSIQELGKRFPGAVRLVQHDVRRGVSCSKDDAVRNCRGNTILLLDGHTKPERGAVERLIADVEELDGKALVTPCVPALDCETWKARPTELGFGFRMDLEYFDCEWLGLQKLKPRGRFFESPAFVGCALALSRDAYEVLKGFDRGMICWGQEDLDFSLKAWLMGYPILNDPRAVIAHRFREKFDNFSVTGLCTFVNTARMARKNFTEETWQEWLPKYNARRTDVDIHAALEIFEEGRDSVEEERSYLLARRAHDEHWYARTFALSWPATRPTSTRQESSGEGE